MGYGITSSSQLIDINTIKEGILNFKSALRELGRSGRYVEEAGDTCNAKALSFDGSSLEFMITDLGLEIQEAEKLLYNYADDLYYAVQSVYNQQVRELNNYNATIAAQQQSQSNN